MLQVEYNNRQFTGETKEELIKKMHLARLSLRDISKTLTAQLDYITHETVRTNLIEQGIYNPDNREIPELEREETFVKTDEEIAAELHVPVSTVIRARKRFDLKSGNKPSSIKLNRRRNWLAENLFDAKPGPGFSEFVLDVIEQLPGKRGRLIEDFYLKGLDSADENEGYERVYRSKARKQLKELLKGLDRKFLIEKGIILENDD